ncbi:hypothetical protein GF352_01825|nr:hypothetical protein [archaeon]
MKCELCPPDQNDHEQIEVCKVCETRFCSDCGKFDLMLCNDCIEFEAASDGELDDIND